MGANGRRKGDPRASNGGGKNRASGAEKGDLVGLVTAPLARKPPRFDNDFVNVPKMFWSSTRRNQISGCHAAQAISAADGVAGDRNSSEVSFEKYLAERAERFVSLVEWRNGAGRVG